MIKVNKQGQALGRKGGETRRRLLDAALELIATEDSHKLSASRIARAAGVASQSFYLYFKDIEEVLLTLSQETVADFDEVISVLADATTDVSADRLSRRLVDALANYWGRHRAILNVRNYMADAGNPAFLKLRYETTIPLIDRLAERMLRAQPAIAPGDARGRAITIYQAMERTVARENAVQYPGGPQGLDLRSAAADVLTLLLTAAPPR